tara:strand:+ start:207 stop:434 length:228 start_codon:yes stop_codon:yes gene_type:complete
MSLFLVKLIANFLFDDFNHRSVAQLVEHRSPKPGVAGSIPAAPALAGKPGVAVSQQDPLEILATSSVLTKVDVGK